MKSERKVISTRWEVLDADGAVVWSYYNRDDAVQDVLPEKGQRFVKVTRYAGRGLTPDDVARAVREAVRGERRQLSAHFEWREKLARDAGLVERAECFRDLAKEMLSEGFSSSVPCGASGPADDGLLHDRVHVSPGKLLASKPIRVRGASGEDNKDR